MSVPRWGGVTAMTPDEERAIRDRVKPALWEVIDNNEALHRMATGTVDRRTLLAEVDRLRAGIEALADAHCLHDKYATALLYGDDLAPLLNPTEGEDR